MYVYQVPLFNIWLVVHDWFSSLKVHHLAGLQYTWQSRSITGEDYAASWKRA